jgi:hypothetical protein
LGKAGDICADTTGKQEEIFLNNHRSRFKPAKINGKVVLKPIKVTGG